MEANREIIPDEENAALQVLKAQQLIPRDWLRPEKDPDGKDFSQFTDAREKLPAQCQLSDSQIAAFRTELGKAEPALVEARKIAELPRGRFPIEWKPERFDYQGLQERNNLLFLLIYDSMLRSQDENLEGAFVSFRAAINTARASGKEYGISALSVRTSCTIQALHSLERLLAQGTTDNGTLATAQKLLELEDNESKSVVLFALRGQRALVHRSFEEVYAGLIPFASFEISEPRSDLFKVEFLDFCSASDSRRAHAAFLRLATRFLEPESEVSPSSDRTWRPTKWDQVNYPDRLARRLFSEADRNLLKDLARLALWQRSSGGRALSAGTPFLAQISGCARRYGVPPQST